MLLKRRLQQHGRHVLATRGDENLLAPADDEVVAVVVHLAEVTGVKPALRVDGVLGLLLVVHVPEHRGPRPGTDLGSLGELGLTAWCAPADRADLAFASDVDM